ncbi:MAG: hypothetical protein J7M26_03480, partial [Armatimonadetes bacterium]|nr:hypothetical protein [Armatimonadota bacterium]
MVAASLAFGGTVETSQLRVRHEGPRVTAIANRLTGTTFSRGTAPAPWPAPLAGARLTARGLGDGSIELVVSPAKTEAPTVLTIALGPFEASADPARPSRLRVLSLAYDGMVIDEHSGQWSYNLGSSPLPMVLLDRGTGGVVVWAERLEEYTSVHVLRRQRSVEIELRCGQPRLLSGEVMSRPCRWRLAAYRGDWRRGADVYRRWLEKQGSCRPLAQRRPQWLRQIRGVARLTMGDREELLAALRHLAQLVEPSTVVVYYPDWRKHPYDVAYPDYEPSADARRLIPAARALGFRVMVHGNFAGMSPKASDFAAFEASTLLGASGKPIFGGPDICQLNPAFGTVRARLVSAFVEAYRECPFDALHLDYPALTDAPRRTRGELSPREGAELYLRRLAAALPDVALGTEWLGPVLIRHCSFSQQPWMVHSDDEAVTTHPLGRYLLGRYRHLYAHLATPSQNSPAPYGALVWLLRLGELGGLPTIVVGPDFDPQGRVAKAILSAMREGLARDGSGRPQVAGVVYGQRAARAPEGLEGWVAQRGEEAFGLDPASAYWVNSRRPPSGTFRLVSCSQPVQVMGGVSARRVWVHLEPLAGAEWKDLVLMPPDRVG